MELKCTVTLLLSGLNHLFFLHWYLIYGFFHWLKKGTSGGNKDVRKGTAPFYCKKHESNVCQLQLVHISSTTRRTTATSQHFSLLDEL